VAVVGGPGLVEACREILAGAPEAPQGEADAVVYAGGDLAELARVARGARRRPFAALVPAALERDAWRIPWARPEHMVTRVEALPRALAGAIGPDGAPLAARVPALRDHVARDVTRRAARQTALVAI